MTNILELEGVVPVFILIIFLFGLFLLGISITQLIRGKKLSVFLSTFLFNRSRYFRKRTIKRITKDWRVGDNIVLERDAILRMRLQNPCTPQLAGFYEDYVFIKCGSLTINMGWDDVMYNKSHTWRKFYSESKKFMGQEPGFQDSLMEVNSQSDSNSESTTELDVRFLTEIECKVYLDIALENEDYELADKLRKRLEELE
jgi:hypothetical protein